jgi:hypothetical protein
LALVDFLESLAGWGMNPGVSFILFDLTAELLIILWYYMGGTMSLPILLADWAGCQSCVVVSF